MTKKICYTCITGKYDEPIEIEYKTPGWEYILFTDNIKLKSKTWNVIVLKNTRGLDPVRFARHVKIQYDQYLPRHSVNLWVDGNVSVKGNLNEFISKINNKGSAVYTVKHPNRDCIYDEAEECIKRAKDHPDIINRQMIYYENHMQVPKDIGLHETNCIIRINHPEVISFMAQWFRMVSTFSRRDQLSFDVIRLNYRKDFISNFSSETRDNFCQWNPGHRGSKKK